MKINQITFLLIVLVSFTLNSCGGSSTVASSSDTPPSNNTNFSNTDFDNPVEVVILGYSGDAMEPHISRDGNTLFFNNLNAPHLSNGVQNDTNLHYANRIDDTTFQYMGEVAGANTDNIAGVNELEGVASIDKNGKFYFVSTVDYLNTASPNYLLSMFQSDYADGILTNVQSLPNLKSDRPDGKAPVPGELNFDAEIDYNGEFLYYVEGVFSGNPFPDEANLAVATDIGGVFTPDTNSNEKFVHINTDALEYAPSISTDRLELYFTRATGSVLSSFDFGIYLATRDSVLEAWQNVKRIEVIDGEFTEGPSISFDTKRLYYHQKVSDTFKIYVVKRAD